MTTQVEAASVFEKLPKNLKPPLEIMRESACAFGIDTTEG